MPVLVLTALVLSSLCSAQEVAHPVYPSNVTAASAAGLQAAVKELLAMSDQELRDFVPKVNGFLFCGCPNCDMGTQEGQIKWKGMTDPDKAQCRFCGFEYPSDKYPEDRTKTGANFRGETVTYRYYRDAEGNEYFFSGRISYDKKLWLSARLLDLAKLYAATKDPQVAHKAAVLLQALAEAYSGWCAHDDWPFRPKGPVPPKPPFPTTGGMWNRWFYTDVPKEPLLAYDLIAESGALEELSAELGRDVRKQIEEDFFRFSIWFVRTYKEEYSNMSPGIYEGLIIAGRVLGDPSYVHDGVERFKGLLQRQFFHDGFWREGSISYHDQTIFWMNRVADTVKGYSDPAGYTDEITGQRYDDLDLMAQFPLAKTALNMRQRYVYPDGRIIPTHDAWPYSSVRAPERSEPWILPGMGQAILGCGRGQGQVQAQLHFSGGYGHEHRDNLHLSLHAAGHELLPDLGYTHTRYRAWTVCTPAHNTVAIDEQEQASRGHVCNLTLWAPDAGIAQVVEAESRASYPGKAEDFRRMLALVPVGDAEAYVLDVFRVTGGAQHDYFLHGSADVEQAARCDAHLQSIDGSLLGPGVEFRLPTLGESDSGKAPAGRNPAYGFIQNLREGPAGQVLNLAFEPEGAGARYAGSFLCEAGTRIALGDAPSIRRAKEDDKLVDRDRMPVAVLRRSGGAPLSSVFAAIHRGWDSADPVQSVTRLDGVEAPPGAVALEVRHGDGTDILLSCAQYGAPIRAGGNIITDARFALIRRDGEGRLISASLVGGTVLEHGDVSLRCDGPLTGELLRAGLLDAQGGRYGLDVSTRLPAGTALAGQTILLTQQDGRTHGHLIASVEDAGAGSRIWLDGDPGFLFEDGKTQFISFPQGESAGPVQFSVESVVGVSQAVE